MSPFTTENTTNLFHVAAPCSIKRKADTFDFESSSAVCDVCHSNDPILQSKSCGHVFHSRCVSAWPLTACPVCATVVDEVSLMSFDLEKKPALRSGKWTKEEEAFVAAVITSFENGEFPLASGTPVRLLLAAILNCSPMRLSKKFQKNALGKRTYHLPKANSDDSYSYSVVKGKKVCPPRISFDKESHEATQRRISALEVAFREQMVALRFNDNSATDGIAELQALRVAVRQFWAHSFLKFAIAIGQEVEGVDVSSAKKKKSVLTHMRKGRYSQVFTWNQNSNLFNFNTPKSHGKVPDLWNPIWAGTTDDVLPVAKKQRTAALKKRSSFEDILFDLLDESKESTSTTAELFNDELLFSEPINNSNARQGAGALQQWEQLLLNDLVATTPVVSSSSSNNVSLSMIDPALNAWSSIQLA